MAGYQIKVTMEGTKPPMWRRLEIPEQITFQSLHDILQEAFGWEDAHLHEFSFQNTRVTAGADENAEYEEDKLLVDEFLPAGWIRYTYDFGDDWRHRIVLEKELPDYKERYARVVKFKRDNFAEDSGGIWADCDYEDEEDTEDGGNASGEELFYRTEPYDMNRVNERLKKMICPAKPKARTAKDVGILVDEKKQIKANRDKAFEMLRTMGQVLKEVNALDKPAPIDLLAEKGNKLWYDFKEQKSWACRSMGLKMRDILHADGTKHLMELLKYLAVPDDDMVLLIDSMAIEVAETIKEHPEYLVYMIPAQELRRYVSWFRGRKTETLPEWHILLAFYMWGLAELELNQIGGKPFLHINLPSDAGCIVEYLEEQGRELDAQERAADRIWERIEGMLLCYGFIEVQALHEQYKKVFGEISREDFHRHLYLSGRFRGEVVTGGMGTEDGMEQWTALDEATADAVIGAIGQAEAKSGKTAAQAAAKEYRKNREKLEYAEFTRKQILEMVRDGYAAVYPQWDILMDSMERVLCQRYLFMEEWEAEELLDDWYGQVHLGAGMRALLEQLEDVKGTMQREDWLLLEHALCRCWSETGLPQLKGHSRLEIAGQTGQSIFAVASEDGYELPGYDIPGNDTNQRNGAQDTKAETAIAPDDVCPCGSGKRYRQCCGRKKKA